MDRLKRNMGIPGLGRAAEGSYGVSLVAEAEEKTCLNDSLFSVPLAGAAKKKDAALSEQQRALLGECREGSSSSCFIDSCGTAETKPVGALSFPGCGSRFLFVRGRVRVRSYPSPPGACSTRGSAVDLGRWVYFSARCSHEL